MEVTNNYSDMLQLLQSQVKNYPSMMAFYLKHIPVPSIVFVPQTLRLLDGEFTRNTDFLYECMSFLDTVSMFSIQETGNPDGYFDNLISGLATTRTVVEPASMLIADQMNNIIYSDKENFYRLVNNNKNIVSMYIFAMVCKIFFITEI